MKVRIIDNYHPCTGNWYTLQWKRWLMWHNVGLSFRELKEAKIAKKYIEESNVVDKGWSPTTIIL